jgi:hypothetical protein
LLVFDIKRPDYAVEQRTWINVHELVGDLPFIVHTPSIDGVIYEPADTKTKHVISELRDVQREPSLDDYCGFISIDDVAKEKLNYAMFIHGVDGSAYVRGGMNARFIRSLLIDNSGTYCKTGFILMYDQNVHLSKISHTTPGRGDVIFNDLKDTPLTNASTTRIRSVNPTGCSGGFIIGQSVYLTSLLAMIDCANFKLEHSLSLPPLPIII